MIRKNIIVVLSGYGIMRSNLFGRVVRDEWFKTSEVRQNAVLCPYEFVIMPNHIHGIIRIVNDN